MGCKNTKCEDSIINSETKRNVMFRAGFNVGEQAYGIQFGLASNTQRHCERESISLENDEEKVESDTEFAASLLNTGKAKPVISLPSMSMSPDIVNPEDDKTEVPLPLILELI